MAGYLRGHRVGAIAPTGEHERGTLAPAVRPVSYWCSAGHESRPAFIEGAVAPDTWDCNTCGRLAGRTIEGPPSAPVGRQPKTPLEHLYERRSPDEGDRIVAEALARLRALEPGGSRTN